MDQCLSSDTCTTWKEHVGSPGGRKKRQGQDNKTELLQVCAGAVIQAGDPLIKLDMCYLQEN